MDLSIAGARMHTSTAYPYSPATHPTLYHHNLYVDQDG